MKAVLVSVRRQSGGLCSEHTYKTAWATDHMSPISRPHFAWGFPLKYLHRHLARAAKAFNWLWGSDKLRRFGSLLAVYTGGSHRTTDMSPAPNKRGGQEGNAGKGCERQLARQKVRSANRDSCFQQLKEYSDEIFTQRNRRQVKFTHMCTFIPW